MAKVWKYAELAINSASEILGNVCNIVILIISFFIFYEVIARYFFGSPTIWVTETCQYLLPILCFWGASYCLKHKGHISVDLFVSRFPYKIRQIVDAMVGIAALVFCILLGWQGYRLWKEALIYRFTSGGIFDIQLWMPYIVFPIGMLFLCFQYIAEIIKSAGNFLKS